MKQERIKRSDSDKDLQSSAIGVGVKTLDESQHAHRVLVTELAPHPLLPSPLQQGQAETGLRPGAQLSCGSAGQPRISSLTVGCGPGPGARADGQIVIIFHFSQRRE